MIFNLPNLFKRGLVAVVVAAVVLRAETDSTCPEGGVARDLPEMG